MSDINFCNTKEQLNHLGEVVTGKVSGSPTGADIDTSTLTYTGQVRKTLPALESEYEQSITDKEADADAAIDEYRLTNKGAYAAGITLENKFEFITYSGESYFATNPPYTTTATTPDNDTGNLFVGGYVNESQANDIASEVLKDEVSTYTDIVYKASGGNSAVENMISGVPITASVGVVCQCENGSIFKRVSISNPAVDSDFELINNLSVADYGVESKPGVDDYTKLQLASDQNEGVDLILPRKDTESSQALFGSIGTIKGSGGTLVNTEEVPAFFYDGIDKKPFISDVETRGSIVPSGLAAYCAFFRGMENPKAKGFNVDGYTGAIIATDTRGGLFTDIYSKNNVYHPALVAGGYGILLQNANDTISNNMHFYAGSGDDNGRHALYISRVDDPIQDYCRNTVSTNIIAKYEDKDDRNFWAFNTRKSINTVTTNFVIDGANGGISLFPEDGVIKNHINANGVVKVEKYADGTAVYGLSQLATSDRVEGFIDSNLILEVKPKVGASLSDGECFAYNLSGVGGMVTNVVTNVPSASSPFAIQGLCSNVLISNIVDIVDDSGTKEPMFSFIGAAADISYDITIKNIVTNRPMFNYDRLVLIGKNITVDWVRTASMTSGLINDNDHFIVSGVSLGSSSVTVVFYDHVTEDAITSADIRLDGSGNVGYEVITDSTPTQLTIRFFDRTTGAIIDPTTTNVNYTVILSR